MNNEEFIDKLVNLGKTIEVDLPHDLYIIRFKGKIIAHEHVYSGNQYDKLNKGLFRDIVVAWVINNILFKDIDMEDYYYHIFRTCGGSFDKIYDAFINSGLITLEKI